MAEQAKTETKSQDLTPKNPEQFKAAIEKGKEKLASGGTKVEAAQVIYDLIKSEHRDVICKAFITGAKLTERGAPTYFYNIKRKEGRKKKA